MADFKKLTDAELEDYKVSGGWIYHNWKKGCFEVVNWQGDIIETGYSRTAAENRCIDLGLRWEELSDEDLEELREWLHDHGLRP